MPSGHRQVRGILHRHLTVNFTKYSTHGTETSSSAFYPRNGYSKSTIGGKCLEFTGPRKSIPCLYRRYRVAQSLRIPQRPPAGRGVPNPQMAERIQLQTKKRTLG